MEKKYINQNRYKKIARNERKKRTEARGKKKRVISDIPINNKRIPNTEKKSNHNKSENKKILFIIYFFLIVAIAAISRLIFKDKSSPFIPNIFKGKEINNQEMVIAVINQQLDGNYIDNVVIKELDSYAYPMLLVINNQYDIEYKLIESIDKLSNKEYVLNVNNNYKITATEIKEMLEEYRTESSIYHTSLKNIDTIEILDKESIKINLKKSDNYFIYNLELPIYTTKDNNKLNYRIITKEKNKRIYLRNDDADQTLINKVTVINLKNLDEAITKYKNKEVDVFFANSKRVMQLLGKYEYNISSYRDGKTLFLLGNLDSLIYSIEEVRKAISYGINRENILNNVFSYNVGFIDIPYIYSTVEYQYDIYAANNLLLSKGFKKKKNIYVNKTNKQNTALDMQLLVNKNDDEKIKVAEYIKQDLKEVGMNIDIVKLTKKSLENKITKGNYHLVLADIYINTNPDISFIHDIIKINESLKGKVLFDNEINLINLKDSINNIIKDANNKNIYYGIKADNTYMIYSKELSDISNIEYMNLFGSIMKSVDK